MVEIPNPWLTQSEAANSRALDAGAAPDLGRSSAAPAPIAEPSMTMEVPTEALAALTSPIDAGATWDINAIDCVNEIFWFVRNKLKDEPPRFVLDESALMDAIDEPPLFLRQRAAE